MDIGFHDAGFKIVECNELEPAFAATLHKNSEPTKRLEGANVICGDVHQYHPSVKSVDFIIGGPPCQTFSAAGARAAGVNGLDDNRGNLFLQYARLIEYLQPKGFLFENVYRIVGAQSGRPWRLIQAAFERLGYKLYWRILDSADYGVPQFRERLIIVGLKQGSFEFPFPSHGPDSLDGRNYYTAKQAVTGIDTSDCKIGLGGRHGHLLNEIPPGLNYSYYTERMGHPQPVFGWRSKFSDYLYKADPDLPVRTIKAQGGQYTGPFSWENRPFTTLELKRLQTFPDDYIIEGGRQTVIHQIGNSVPPQLGRVLALSILQQVFGVQLPFKIATMSAALKLGFRQRKASLTNVYAIKAASGISKNRTSPETNANTRGVDYVSVAPNLRLQVGVNKESADYLSRYTLNSQAWCIYIDSRCGLSVKHVYEILIIPPRDIINLKNFPENGITLVSQSREQRSLIALWKTCEFFVKQQLLKDDLIQLFGYYQYKQTFSFKMVFQDSSLDSDPFWHVVRLVTSGLGVGRIIAVRELSELYEVSELDLLKVLLDMKELGYEIRSHSTNKQIQDGMFLIPYSFPTLNERSLQRLTRLSNEI